MPTYSYVCKNCGHSFDFQQSIHDTALTKCPECQGELRKSFGQIGVTFKGSGFYRTDSAAAAKPPSAKTQSANPPAAAPKSDS